jgi:hypothetical protein
VHTEAETICNQIRAAFQYARTEEEVQNLHPNTVKVVAMMVADVALEDLTPSEALAFRAFMSPIHARILATQAKQGGPPSLRVVS